MSDDKDSDDVSMKTALRAGDFLRAIDAREAEFEKGWWKQAKIAQDIYNMEGDSKDPSNQPYNILYSNTEVLQPSLYSATPKPDIRSRFKGANLKPLPLLVERYLTVAADPAQPGLDNFDAAMTDAVLSALVPGSGYIRIRHIESRAFPIVYESGRYDTMIWGKAPRWSKVPWVAFKHPMTKQQMMKQFALDLDEVQEKYVPSSETEEEKDDCCVYEFWDKATKTVYFLCEEWADKELKAVPDPLGLAGFFPTPGPLLLTGKPGKLQPTPLYRYYQNQAEELNRVSVRLNKVLSAIKVRGAYSTLLGTELGAILGSDELENGLVPASESALLAQSGGFDKLIWLLPIEKFITVAQELYKAREAIKQVIYELTGISDIIRGSSVASETATAQDLKAKWGTVRLRKMQKAVADYSRDLFRMTIDCSADKVSAEQWLSITQLEIPTEAQKQVAKQQLAYNQQQQMMMPPIPGQPPQPPQQPDPALVKAAQSPSIEEVLGKIKSDANRTYVINIQTSSTIDLDSAQDKGEVGEYMNAMGQLMSGMQPLMALGPTGLEAVKAILVSVSQRYKFGIDIADVIAAVQFPPPPPPEAAPPGPSPEEQAALKAEAQLKLEKVAMDRQIMQAQGQLDLEKIQAERTKLSLSIQAAELSLASKRTKMASSTESA